MRDVPGRSHLAKRCARLAFALIFFWLTAAALTAEDEPDAAKPVDPKKTWITTQEKGIVQGSFAPWRRGLKLPPNPKVMVIPVDDKVTSDNGWIDDWQANFIRRRLKIAEHEKYDLVILEIDSRGGELDACERITKDIETCKVPVVAFVKNKALSGGAILALGCKLIIMEPRSDIGAAKVVNMGGDFSTAMRQKGDSHMRALMRNLCDANGHPEALAQGMVDSAIEVIETDDSTNRFMTDVEFAAAEKHGATQVRKWKQKDQILTLTASEARSTGLASGLASNVDEVMLGMGTPGTPAASVVTRADISTSEKVARFLNYPLWRVLLVIVGLVMLFLELKSPGHGFGYAGFAICMGFFFWLQIFQQNAGLLELAMFAVGSVLVAMELFVLPTFGALGFVGVVSVIVSIILAFLPEGSLPGLLGASGRTPDYLMRQIIDGMAWATLTLLSVVGFFMLVWWKGIKLPGFNRLALNTVNAGTVSEHGFAAPQPASTGISGNNTFVGKFAETETVLRPAGKIRLDGRTYDAMSEGDYIDAGKKVQVLRTQGSALVVRLAAE